MNGRESPPAVPAIDVPLDPSTRISLGNDSNVYVVGNQVAKDYHSLSFDAVRRYVDLLSDSVDAVTALGYSAPVKIRGVQYELHVTSVVAVDLLGTSPAGRPMTLSRFVEAPSLEKLMFPPQSFCEYARNGLADPALRQFGFDVNALFWTEYPTRVQDEFHYHVAMLSRLLDQALGVAGLYIGKYNAKFAPAAARVIEMTLTDLAVYVDRIDYGAR